MGEATASIVVLAHVHSLPSGTGVILCKGANAEEGKEECGRMWHRPHAVL